MSLINQMLRDLDARHAPAADRPTLQNGVHAAQKRQGRTWPMLALALALIAVTAAGSWYWLVGRSEPVPPPQLQVSPSAQRPSPPASAAQPAVTPQVPAPAAPPAPVAQHAAVPATAAAGKPAGAAPVQPRQPEMKESAPAKASKLARAPTRKTVAAEVETPALPVTSEANAAPAATAAEASIEKRPHTSIASEVAENEYNKAIAALRRGANAEAIEHLRAALRIDMLHVSARQALLSLMMRQQQWGEAQTLAEEGLALDPTQTGWAIALARLQMENGKLAEATETLARHAAYAERNADYQAFHALLLQKQKRYGEASERYYAAVALRPAEGRWWYGLGASLEADQKPQDAREAFLKAKEAGNLPPELAGALKQHLR